MDCRVKPGNDGRERRVPAVFGVRPGDGRHGQLGNAALPPVISAFNMTAPPHWVET
jgi:hypothetical protein